jgi:hypothetical protein
LQGKIESNVLIILCVKTGLQNDMIHFKYKANYIHDTQLIERLLKNYKSLRAQIILQTTPHNYYQSVLNPYFL